MRSTLSVLPSETIFYAAASPDSAKRGHPGAIGFGNVLPCPLMPGATIKNNTAELLGGRRGLQVSIARVERAGCVGAHNGALWIGLEGHSTQQATLPAARPAKRTSSNSAGSISLHNMTLAYFFAPFLETNAPGRRSHR